jgi:hypothetical protein
MKRTNVTYSQLDKVLRSLGFSCRSAKHDPPGRIYEHKEAGAKVMLPALPANDQVFEHHMAAVRLELENFGIANPTAFDAKFHKAS